MPRDKNIAIDGQAYALNVLTPIRPGCEAELRDALAVISQQPRSPFARLDATHFARLLIIDRLAFEGKRERRPQLRTQYLLFSSVFDGPLDTYLRALCELIGDDADAIWGCCLGAPRRVGQDVGAFTSWIRHNQVQSGAFFAPYGHATVSRIQHSLECCELLREFAENNQHLSAPDLKRQFDKTFGVA